MCTYLDDSVNNNDNDDDDDDGSNMSAWLIL